METKEGMLEVAELAALAELEELRATATRLELWVDALRHGGYAQGARNLKARRPDGTDEYCCMGVAAEHALRQECKPPNFAHNGVAYMFQGEDDDGECESLLGHTALTFLGLRDRDQAMFINLNDSGCSFAHIAIVIQAMFVVPLREKIRDLSEGLA